MLAYWQRKYPTLAESGYRSDLGLTLGINLVPTSWLVSIFYSGFWEYGWCLSKDGCESISPLSHTQ